MVSDSLDILGGKFAMHFLPLNEYGQVLGATLVGNWASLVAQMVKNLPAVQEIWVRSLGWEDPLDKGITTHASILAWRIPDRAAWQATAHKITKSWT